MTNTCHPILLQYITKKKEEKKEKRVVLWALNLAQLEPQRKSKKGTKIKRAEEFEKREKECQQDIATVIYRLARAKKRGAGRSPVVAHLAISLIDCWMSRRRAAGAGTHALARFVTKHSSMRRREVVWRRQTCLSLARSALWARRRRSIGRGGRVYGAASCGFASPSRQSRKVKSAALAAAIEYKPLSQKNVVFFLHFLTGPSELQTCQKLHFYSPCCLLFLM